MDASNSNPIRYGGHDRFELELEVINNFHSVRAPHRGTKSQAGKREERKRIALNHYTPNS